MLLNDLRLRHVIWILPIGLAAWIILNWRPESTALPGPISYTPSSDLASGIPLPMANRSRPTVPSVFATNYPASTRLKDELKYARQMGKLKPENEELIVRVINAMGAQYNMPPSVLW
ncbi:MAG: hypothetical protein HYR96_01425, partial [Deltaproteobacteria bacterium]|nr:hypothetical protein [Deltaproteobacteria bacterium]